VKRGRSQRSQAGLALFAGWKRLEGTDQLYGVPDWYERPPTSAATTWLLAVGWLKHGLVGEHEVPGPQSTLA
jgi:hypothetical protein